MRRISLLLAAAAIVLVLPGCVLDFSPDGKQVVFCWPSTGEKTAVALMNTDGTGFRMVPGSEDYGLPSWSPDGKTIVLGRVDVLTKGQQPKPARLYDIATGRTRDLPGNLHSPTAWREDGKRLAACQQAEDGATRIVFYDLAEGGTNLRVALPQGMEVQTMEWLPGTDDIAFVGTVDKKDDVYTVEAGELHKITTSGDVIALTLDRKGNRLIWARKSPNLKYILLSVYAFDLNARSARRLPFPDRVPLINPDPRHAPDGVDIIMLSPDGSHLALSATMGRKIDAKGNISGREVCYVVRMDGAAAKQLEQTALSPEYVPMLFPVWSHDGKQLAVAGYHGKVASITLYDPDGNNARTIRSMGK